MLRVYNKVESNVFNRPIPPITLAANVAQDVLPDERLSGIEYAFRELFNAGSNNAYYSFGSDVSLDAKAPNYNAFIAPGQMLEVATLERVNMLSPGGTIISITRLQRDEMVQPNKNIIPQ
jgi:hypothetical protein